MDRNHPPGRPISTKWWPSVGPGRPNWPPTGWVGITWPVDLGGRGLGPTEHFLVTEEMARARAPELVGRIGINLVAPTLLAHGTPPQCESWLPPILGAEELWCQLFSEPEAGSDLASLATRAERTDGGWLLTGTKVWTSYAQFADWGLCLARSDPEAPKRQQGITCLVVDMHSPGVEVHPLVQITGDAEFNEVFLDGVFVPDRQAGRRPRGRMDSGQLHLDPRTRSKSPAVGHPLPVAGRSPLPGRQPAGRIRQLGRPPAGSRGLHRGQAVPAPQLADAHPPGKRRTARARGKRPQALLERDVQAAARDGMALLGPASPLWQGATDNPGGGMWQRSWLYYQASSIFAGTNEVQRTLVGERVLGLPRD